MPEMGSTLATIAPPGRLGGAIPSTGSLPDGATPRRLVLVVEDEEMVATVTVETLEILGYAAIWCENAVAALTWLLDGHQPDILLSDIRMPGEIDGLGLAEAVRARWPAIRILLASGYTASRDHARALGFTLLEKPYRLAVLCDALNNLQRH